MQKPPPHWAALFVEPFLQSIHGADSDFLRFYYKGELRAWDEINSGIISSTFTLLITALPGSSSINSKRFTESLAASRESLQILHC